MSRITTQSLFETSVHKSSWRSYVVSMGVHAGLVALAFAVVVPMAIEVHNSYEHVQLVAPMAEYKPKPEVQHLLASKVIVHQPIPPPAKKFVAPAIVVPPVVHPQIVEAPEINSVQPQPELKVDLPPAPKAPFKMGVFQPPTEVAKTTPTVPKMQVGGFGDPRGAQPSDNARNSPVMLAKVGVFDLPDNTGHNGGGGKSQAGNTIKQTGFGNTDEPGRPKMATEGIRSTAFGDATLTPPPANKNVAVAGNGSTQVQILFKPKPAYTAEARNLRLEGEVSLQVIFQADGTIHVVKVVRGLGHGLDEAAQEAAMKVRFKPATRAGVPVDTNATIKISFELT